MSPHNIEKNLKELRYQTGDSKRQAILNTLSAALETKTKSKPASSKSGLRRIIMSKPITKLAIAAAVVIAALIVFQSNQFVTPTFAQVIKPLFEAQTIVFDFVVGKEDDPKTTVIHDIVKGQMIRRTISTLPNTTMIIDIDGKRMLNLEKQSKGALYSDITGSLEEGTRSFLKFIRETLTRVQSYPGFKPKELPEKEFDGRELIGFLSENPNERIVVWADPKTALPVRIEMKMGPQDIVLKNFEFDILVDDELVSMDIPAGYTISKKQLDLSNPTEEDFVAILGVIARDVLNGQFPDNLTTQEFMSLIVPLQQALGKKGVSQEEGEKIGESYAKGMVFMQLFELHHKGTCKYLGKGVKYGDASKAVFWYKFKDAQTWRVVYGDMTVKDAAEEPQQ
jgi:outer membrane lipoprotein-sorting protein